ncbi:KilA-N domain-containing protein [Carnimonas bestiolae]|uniref:KilA-N domain-containing protein n=1 Tax=Carnimonas bestiolae TaxID=3402172 RepID=UPI003EDC81AA
MAYKNRETPTAATVEASNQKSLAQEVTDMTNSSTVLPSSNVHVSTLPVIAGHEIAIDEHGRFNLNAIHSASGEGEHKRPSKWTVTVQAKELVSELDSNSPNSGFKALESRKGRYGGTYAHELLAVSYAGWISPKFQLQVNQVFLDYRMGKLASNRVAESDPVNALPAPLTPAHQHGIQKEVAIRVFSKVKDKANHPKAYKAIYRYLKSRFEVGSYKDIPDSKYTQALAAIESAPLEGEWIEAKPKRLAIHYPVSQWRKENPQFEQFQSNLPSNQLRVNHDMLLRKDAPVQSSSPTVALLNQLQDDGYNVDACVAEVNGLFSATADMDAFLRGFQRGIGSVLSDTATITYHS